MSVTRARDTADAGAAESPFGPGWRGARRELAVAFLLVVALTAGAWAADGRVAAGFVALFCLAGCVLVLRVLLRPDLRAIPPEEPYRPGPSLTFAGFWRTQADLIDSARSLTAWDYGTRPRLQNLLAARLAERHGVSLADDPETARRLVVGPGGREELWFWIDPARQTPPDGDSRSGIPPRTLAALIDRLEKL
jgi:hypothetical protein